MARLRIWYRHRYDCSMIVDYYSGSIGAIFSKYPMSDAENAQRNKEWEADIKKLYPKIGYIKVNGVYQGSK